MSLRVDDFKAKLKGGGARPNLFRVTLNFPAYAGGNAELTSFMCKGAQLPASTINAVDVPFRGRQLKIAGDRTFEDWSVTVINDTGFEVRNAMERWMNGMNGHTANTGFTICLNALMTLPSFGKETTRMTARPSPTNSSKIMSAVSPMC